MRVRAMALVFGALLLTAAVGAQAPPTFEVASVKPSQPGARRGPIGFGGERLVVTAWTLPELMTLAYGQGTTLYRFQISGGPDWLDRERFDITATIDSSKVASDNVTIPSLTRSPFYDVGPAWPSASRYRSASSAAAQPVPAAVTAWR